MEPLKKIKQLREELLTVINGQIAVRRYNIDQLIGSIYPRVVQEELDQLEHLKQEIIKL